MIKNNEIHSLGSSSILAAAPRTFREEGYLDALEDVLAELRAWGEDKGPLHAEGLIEALETL